MRDVIVIGGGPAGLAAAAAVAAAGARRAPPGAARAARRQGLRRGAPPRGRAGARGPGRGRATSIRTAGPRCAPSAGSRRTGPPPRRGCPLPGEWASAAWRSPRRSPRGRARSAPRFATRPRWSRTGATPTEPRSSWRPARSLRARVLVAADGLASPVREREGLSRPAARPPPLRPAPPLRARPLDRRRRGPLLARRRGLRHPGRAPAASAWPSSSRRGSRPTSRASWRASRRSPPGWPVRLSTRRSPGRARSGGMPPLASSTAWCSPATPAGTWTPSPVKGYRSALEEAVLLGDPAAGRPRPGRDAGGAPSLGAGRPGPAPAPRRGDPARPLHGPPPAPSTRRGGLAGARPAPLRRAGGRRGGLIDGRPARFEAQARRSVVN